MGNRTNDTLPPYWPLLPGAITADVLRPYSPIACSFAVDALELGFMTVETMSDLVRDELLLRTTETLKIYTATSNTFSRLADIKLELKKLAGEEDPGMAFWKVAARIIICNYSDFGAALRTLDSLYGWCDYPPQLEPYTLNGSLAGEDLDAKIIISKLSELLDQQLVTRCSAE